MSDETPRRDAINNECATMGAAQECLVWNEEYAKIERELAAVTKERDELTALLESEKATRNHIIDKGVEMQRERDEANAESEKYRIGWGKCDDQLNEAREALREAVETIENTISWTGATIALGNKLKAWRKAAGLEDAQ